MQKNSITEFFKNWDWTRYLRLVFSAILLYAFIDTAEWFYLVLSILFILQAIFNVSCGCSRRACNTPTKKENKTNYNIKKLDL